MEGPGKGGAPPHRSVRGEGGKVPMHPLPVQLGEEVIAPEGGVIPRSASHWNPRHTRLPFRLFILSFVSEHGQKRNRAELQKYHLMNSDSFCILERKSDIHAQKYSRVKNLNSERRKGKRNGQTTPFRRGCSTETTAGRRENVHGGQSDPGAQGQERRAGQEIRRTHRHE